MSSLSAIHLVLGSLLLGLVASRFGLPRVAAYVFAGILFSPSLLGGLLGVRVGAWAEPLTTADEELDDVLHRQLEHEIEDMPVLDANGALLGAVNLTRVLRAFMRAEYEDQRT